jgi:hypothetical protein
MTRARERSIATKVSARMNAVLLMGCSPKELPPAGLVTGSVGVWGLEEDPGPGSPTRGILSVEVPLPKPDVCGLEIGADEIRIPCPTFPDGEEFTGPKW